MTTSFTTSDQFDAQGEGFGEEGFYPEAFGITFTPKVIGTAIGLAGFFNRRLSRLESSTSCLE